MEARLLIDSACLLGEGPVWDERSGTLWWTDIDGKKVHRYHLKSGHHESFSVPERVGAFALRDQGGLVVASEKGWALCEEDGSNWTEIANPEPDAIEHRFNDGKCDAKGRFYAGTYSMKNHPHASLYVLYPDLSWKRLEEGITCSNGITWSADQRIMYYIDSPTKRVDRFDADPESGLVSNRQTVIRMDHPNISPDGMTSDEEGMLWVAEFGGWKVSRWNPHTGEKLMTIDVPAQYVTSCVFGGEEMDELFITTASFGRARGEQQPHAGGIFHVKVGIKGRPTHRFAG